MRDVEGMEVEAEVKKWEGGGKGFIFFMDLVFLISQSQTN